MKRLFMLHIDEGENPVSVSSLEVTKTTSRAAGFIQRKYQTDIVDISMVASE